MVGFSFKEGLNFERWIIRIGILKRSLARIGIGGFKEGAIEDYWCLIKFPRLKVIGGFPDG